MNNELKLVKINSGYCDYLRKFDEKVPYNYAKKELRPFIGVLFEVHNCLYFAPLSSPKPKHKIIKDTLDFFRLDEGNLGAINFNNMIPVTEKNFNIIDLNNKAAFDDLKYYRLLKKQLYCLNRNKDVIYQKSKALYNSYKNGFLNKKMFNRCCNFPLLEEKCIEYNSLKNIDLLTN